MAGERQLCIRDGISFNLGPHALYFRGQAFRLLRDLEIPFTGNIPSPGESSLLTEDGDAPLPRGLVSLIGSKLFGLREKGRLIRFLTTLTGSMPGATTAFRCPMCT